MFVCVCVWSIREMSSWDIKKYYFFLQRKQNWIFHFLFFHFNLFYYLFVERILCGKDLYDGRNLDDLAVQLDLRERELRNWDAWNVLLLPWFFGFGKRFFFLCLCWWQIRTSRYNISNLKDAGAPSCHHRLRKVVILPLLRHTKLMIVFVSVVLLISSCRIIKIILGMKLESANSKLLILLAMLHVQSDMTEFSINLESITLFLSVYFGLDTWYYL